MHTLLVDPYIDAPWEPTYAAFEDELPSGVSEHRWSGCLAAGHELARPYALVDHAALRHELARPGLEQLGEVVLDCERDGPHFRVRTHGGFLAARFVVDASGHAPILLKRQPQPALGWQTAFGWLLEVEQHPFDLDRMVFLDLQGPADPLPTFLYAMPLGPRRLFVEETSLIAAVSPEFGLLRERLQRRLSQLGVQGRVLATERCRFPMGEALPCLDQPVLGFGAAAGFVHPATGYSLASTLAMAPRLADALARVQDPREAWAALWPQERLRSRALHRFGAQVLLGLDQAGTRGFFEAFFRLPESQWRAYLRVDSEPTQLAAAMTRVFREADLRSRMELVASGLSPRGLELARTLLHPGGS